MLVADGDYYLIECAIRADRTSPAAQFLEQLEFGQIDAVTDELREPDEQVGVFEWLVKAWKKLADTGRPVHGGMYNQLHDGIWEFKRGNARLPFYDTDGQGSCDPKIDDVARLYTHPWPDFDEVLRLTTGFEKSSAQAPPGEIDLAKQVREEDLNHDRSTTQPG